MEEGPHLTIPPVHHPLDARYFSVVDEPQTELIFGFTLVTHSVRNRSHYTGRQVRK
jgi:hypothetical protein